MSSICPGLSIRGRSRRPSHLVDTQPIAKVADWILKNPIELDLLRRIDEIRGGCEAGLEQDPGMNQLKSRQLVRFYSSRRGRHKHMVYVLSKGDMLLDELDRRERETLCDDSMIRLVEPDMTHALVAMDASGLAPKRRSRISYAAA